MSPPVKRRVNLLPGLLWMISSAVTRLSPADYLLQVCLIRPSGAGETLQLIHGLFFIFNMVFALSLTAVKTLSTTLTFLFYKMTPGTVRQLKLKIYIQIFFIFFQIIYELQVGRNSNAVHATENEAE